MFVGSINQDVRTILGEMAVDWKDRAVWVGCSGNLTVERVLHNAGVKELHGNDVSLYSCAVGAHVAGGPEVTVTVQDPAYGWLTPYCEPGEPLIATLLLCSEAMRYAGRDEAYFQRIWGAYIRRWPELHKKTVEKVGKALGDLQLASFYAGDALEYVDMVPDDAVMIAFPPTYKGGYEKLYEKIDATFNWKRPEYAIFDDASFEAFARKQRSKRSWVTLRDHAVVDLEDHLVAIVQTSLRMKPVYLYADHGTHRLSLPRQPVADLPLPRLKGAIEGPLSVVPISQPQLNLLRSEYLHGQIVPAAAQWRFGICAQGELIGALGFIVPMVLGGDWCSVYMMTDLSIAPTQYARLSKLVLAAAVSTEMKALLEQVMSKRLETLGTTAFTNKPVSQKYRGQMFDLYARHAPKDGEVGKLNYVAKLGQWSLKEGLEWWKRKHSASE